MKALYYKYEKMTKEHEELETTQESDSVQSAVVETTITYATPEEQKYIDKMLGYADKKLNRANKILNHYFW